MTSRQQLVASRNTVFEVDSQRSDFLNDKLTSDALVEHVLYMIERGHIIGFTAVKSDHHNDSCLGLASHFDGNAYDCWPLNSPKWGDWVDASTHDFRQFLVDGSHGPHYHQTGLVGDGADLAENFAAAGAGAFQDDGGAHVHFGVTP